MEPWPKARPWPALQARVAGSQPGRMIQKHPGQIELLGGGFRQRFEADRLRRVMGGVENIDAELLGVEKGPVLSLAGHERIEPRCGSLRDQRPSGTGDDSDAMHALGAERKHAWGRAERLGQGPAQVFTFAAVFAPDSGG